MTSTTETRPDAHPLPADLAPARVRWSWNLGVLALTIVLSFVFYSGALDNTFWHAEDFLVLQTAKSIDEDPSLLLRHDAIERHHPVPLALFLAEYRLFGTDARGWYATNLLLHGINAFLVYWLVTALLYDRRIAVLAGVLFALGVGSYGKAVLFVAGAENLLIATLYLLILNLYIRNDLFGGGRMWSVRYASVVVLFLLVSFARPTTLALVGGLLAYKVFFRGERGSQRKILEPHLLVLVLGAGAFTIVRQLTGVVDFSWVAAGEGPVDFTLNVMKNMVNYIIHMFFPIHVSQLVERGHPVVQFVYAIAPLLRVLIGWAIISYSVFGFVFGNRTIRFFLAWTLISVLPYCVIQFPADWLNIRYLYLVSIGFVFIMASGTVLSMDLLHRRPRRRWLPLVVPLAFVLLSGYITAKLDTKYEGYGADAAQRIQTEVLGESSRR